MTNKKCTPKEGRVSNLAIITPRHLSPTKVGEKCHPSSEGNLMILRLNVSKKTASMQISLKKLLIINN